MSDQSLPALKKATKGLLYPSESDSPFVPFRWPAEEETLTPERVATLARQRRANVEEVPVGEFFAELVDADDAARFQDLERLLPTVLSDVRVFRVGETKVKIYLVGKSKEGDWIGLRTVSVET